MIVREIHVLSLKQMVKSYIIGVETRATFVAMAVMKRCALQPVLWVHGSNYKLSELITCLVVDKSSSCHPALH